MGLGRQEGEARTVMPTLRKLTSNRKLTGEDTQRASIYIKK